MKEESKLNVTSTKQQLTLAAFAFLSLAALGSMSAMTTGNVAYAQEQQEQVVFCYDTLGADPVRFCTTSMQLCRTAAAAEPDGTTSRCYAVVVD